MNITPVTTGINHHMRAHRAYDIRNERIITYWMFETDNVAKLVCHSVTMHVSHPGVNVRCEVQECFSYGTFEPELI